MFADWTDRIASGEVPPQPPRPRGEERNVVLTMWDWGDGTTSAGNVASNGDGSGTITEVDWVTEMIDRNFGAWKNNAAPR